MDADMSKPPACRDRVPVKIKLALGVGAFPSFFGYAGVSILAYPVYNMMFGISATWIGIALMLPRLWDGLIGLVVGRASDNFRSHFGRRKLFIISGAIAMGLIFGLIWFVPLSWSDTMKLSYFIVMQILFFTAYAFFAVPYSALIYEVSPDYGDRTRVAAYTAFFHKLAELAGGWMLPLAGLLSIILVAGATGLNMTGIRAMGWLIGILIMAGVGIFPGLYVRERFSILTRHQGSVSIRAGLYSAMRSAAFLTLVAIAVLNTISGVLAMGIDQYILVYFMNHGDKAVGLLQKGLLTTGYGVIGFASIPLITWLAGNLGKSRSLNFAYQLMLVGGVMKWFIFVPGHHFIHVGGVTIDPVILIDPLLCGPMWVAVKIILASMMGDICDEDEFRHGQRREGMFAGIFAWVEKTVLAVSYLGTGLALMFAGFNPALGGAQAPETFTTMRLFLAGAPVATAVLALIAIKFYPISAARAAETRAQLEARRGVVGV